MSYPEIVEMQARAIFEAAIEAGKALHDRVMPEIMVPLVATKGELDLVKDRIAQVARAVEKERGSQRRLFGRHHGRASSRLPHGRRDRQERRVLLLRHQRPDPDHVRAVSRDDAGRFLGEYADKGIIQHDPFVTLDEAVGELMQIAVDRGRAVKPELKMGICGEHGGDPETIGFCERLKLNYVSCSPYRVPVARLAAAQAALQPGNELLAKK